MIILDASLAVKLVIQEPDSIAAKSWFLHLADDIAAPDLIAIEVAQAIVRRVNMRIATPESGQRVLRAWRTILTGGGITLVRTDPAQMETSAALAIRLGHPVKDCLYLSLAMELDCDLVTSDVKFAAKARSVYPAVSLPSDYN